MIPLLVAAGFLAGSIPFGVWIARRLGVDIRQHGSGNIGATNVTRVLGPVVGACVLVLDAGKGALPVLVAQRACGWPWVVVATGAAAILGHCFSPFLDWRGGKGVATAFGVFLVVSPFFAGVAVVVFAAVVAITRIPALGSLAGVTTVSALALARGDHPLATLAVGTAVLLIYTHRDNLVKLRATR